MSLVDFYDKRISPLARALDRHLGVKRINVRYVPTRNFNVVIPYKNRTQIVFFDDQQVHDIMAFDYEMGVLGEQAYDPGERPF